MQAALVVRLLGRLCNSAGSGVSLRHRGDSLAGCLGGRRDFLAVMMVDSQAALVTRLLGWQGRSKLAVYCWARAGPALHYLVVALCIQWGRLASCLKLSTGRM